MLNALCEWSLCLETLWGRTYLLAAISIRMISRSDDVFPFSPRCIMKEISTRCILQQKQQRGRKSVQHWVFSCLPFKLCPCKVPWNLKEEGALKSCLPLLLAYVTHMLQQNMIFQDMKCCFIPWVTQLEKQASVLGCWAFDSVNIAHPVTAKWPILVQKLRNTCANFKNWDYYTGFHSLSRRQMFHISFWLIFFFSCRCANLFLNWTAL